MTALEALKLESRFISDIFFKFVQSLRMHTNVEKKIKRIYSCHYWDILDFFCNHSVYTGIDEQTNLKYYLGLSRQ